MDNNSILAGMLSGRIPIQPQQPPASTSDAVVSYLHNRIRGLEQEISHAVTALNYYETITRPRLMNDLMNIRNPAPNQFPPPAPSTPNPYEVNMRAAHNNLPATGNEIPTPNNPPPPPPTNHGPSNNTLFSSGGVNNHSPRPQTVAQLLQSRTENQPNPTPSPRMDIARNTPMDRPLTTPDPVNAFVCQMCPAAFETRYKLGHHRKTAHKAELLAVKNPRPAADEKAPEFSELAQMLQKMDGPPATSPSPKPEANKNLLSDQLATVPGPVNLQAMLFGCQMCPAAFESQYKLNQHKKLEHQTEMAKRARPMEESGPDVFECKFCLKQFQQRSAWTRHKCRVFQDHMKAQWSVQNSGSLFAETSCDKSGENLAEPEVDLGLDTSAKEGAKAGVLEVAMEISDMAKIVRPVVEERTPEVFECKFCLKRFQLRAAMMRHKCKAMQGQSKAQFPARGPGSFGAEMPGGKMEENTAQFEKDVGPDVAMVGAKDLAKGVAMELQMPPVAAIQGIPDSK